MMSNRFFPEKSANDIEHTAHRIANLIHEVNTDYRGDLLYRIGEILAMNAQGYTGAVLYQAGRAYGLSKGNTRIKPDYQ